MPSKASVEDVQSEFVNATKKYSIFEIAKNIPGSQTLASYKNQSDANKNLKLAREEGYVIDEETNEKIELEQGSSVFMDIEFYDNTTGEFLGFSKKFSESETTTNETAANIIANIVKKSEETSTTELDR